jgi:hypothetical protein
MSFRCQGGTYRSIFGVSEKTIEFLGNAPRSAWASPAGASADGTSPHCGHSRASAMGGIPLWNAGFHLLLTQIRRNGYIAAKRLPIKTKCGQSASYDGDIPKLDRSVSAAGNEMLAIRAKGQGGDALVMGLPMRQFAPT